MICEYKAHLVVQQHDLGTHTNGYVLPTLTQAKLRNGGPQKCGQIANVLCGVVARGQSSAIVKDTLSPKLPLSSSRAFDEHSFQLLFGQMTTGRRIAPPRSKGGERQPQ